MYVRPYKPLNVQGRIQDFFLGGGALVSCSTSTPINHKVFFCRIPVVLEKRRTSRGGGGAHSLHPPPRSAPDVVMQNSSKDYPFGQRFKLVHPMDRQKVEVLDFLTFYCNMFKSSRLKQEKQQKKIEVTQFA